MNSRLGATLRDNGCDFRVWAPHAKTVRVLLQGGTGWEHNGTTEKSDLTKSPDGYWTGFVAGVEAGQLYRYEINNDGEIFQRLDAAARDTIHSELTRGNPGSQNASIVVTNEPYPWSPFETPDFADFLIFQFHCGTFAGRNDHLDTEIATFPDLETKLCRVGGRLRRSLSSHPPSIPCMRFSLTRLCCYPSLTSLHIDFVATGWR